MCWRDIGALLARLYIFLILVWPLGLSLGGNVTCSGIQMDTDLPGGDLGAGTPCSDYACCCTFCGTVLGCAGWTWTGTMCYPKSTLPPANIVPGMVSGGPPYECTLPTNGLGGVDTGGCATPTNVAGCSLSCLFGFHGSVSVDDCASDLGTFAITNECSVTHSPTPSRTPTSSLTRQVNATISGSRTPSESATPTLSAVKRRTNSSTSTKIPSRTLSAVPKPPPSPSCTPTPTDILVGKNPSSTSTTSLTRTSMHSKFRVPTAKRTLTPHFNATCTPTRYHPTTHVLRVQQTTQRVSSRLSSAIRTTTPGVKPTIVIATPALALRCDSFNSSQCPPNKVIVGNAGGVICSRAPCLQEECCGRVATCDTFNAADCPRNSSLIKNANTVQCDTTVCIAEKCCVIKSTCSTFSQCQIPGALKPNPEDVFCNGNCSSSDCCLPAPFCDTFNCSALNGSTLIPNASTVQCQTALCSEEICCVPQASCKTFDGCIFPFIQLNFSVERLCNGSACTVSECCQKVSTCSTFSPNDCGAAAVLIKNAALMQCQTAICSKDDCCQQLSMAIEATAMPTVGLRTPTSTVPSKLILTASVNDSFVVASQNVSTPVLSVSRTRISSLPAKISTFLSTSPTNLLTTATTIYANVVH